MRLLHLCILLLACLTGCHGAAIVARPADGGADATPREDVEVLPVLDAPMADPAARGWVTGRAWDARNGEPLADVEILAGGTVVGRTDSAGAYSVVLPRGDTAFTARAAGRLPFERRIVVGETPRVLDLPLTALGASAIVPPAGATLSLRQGVTLRFPAGAVAAPTMVTATWLDGDGVAALDAPRLVHDGEAEAALRGALVVTDLVVAASVQVEIPVPPDVLPDSLSLRPIDDGEAGARLWPVSSGRGTVVFEVPHFSAWGLWVDLLGARGAAAGCSGQRLAYVNPGRQPSEVYVERGMERLALGVMSMVGQASQPSAAPVDILCGDVVRSSGRMLQLLLGGSFGSLLVTGEKLPFRIFGDALDVRIEVLPVAQPDAKVEMLVHTISDASVRLFLDNPPLVVVEDGSAVRLRRIRCSRGYGWSVIHDNRRDSARGRVILASLSGQSAALSAGSEALFCPSGATPTERVEPVEGSCALPADCAAPTRCDPASQRCVLPRGAACTTNGPPCDDGARCFDGACVAQTPADVDVVPCASDADCPDERCDLARRECRSPLDMSGARPCTARRECGIDEECSPATSTCVPSSVRRCRAHTDCPEGYTCAEAICVPPAPRMCIRDPRRAEAQQAQCPDGYGCDGNAQCSFRACPAGETLCGPRCVRLDSPLHCGACFAAAPQRPNAVPRCVLGAPVFQCLPGFGDCDGDAANGCEARIDREAACGACGVRCAANETCVGQRCSATPRSAVTDLSLGGRYACAIHADGGVSCWGGSYGEPRRMRVRNAVKLSTSRGLACAVTRAGLLSCWTPTRDDLTLEGVTDVALGRDHACVIMQDGSVRCWGTSREGALGNGETIYNSSPLPVRMPTGVRAVQLAAGRAHSCLRGDDGSVWCWGRNEEGQLGDGTTMNRNVPVRVNVQGVSDLRAGFATTLALRDGAVLGWGMGTAGQLGPRRGHEPTPVTVALPNRARSIAVDATHACAVLIDGRVLCQGSSDVMNNVRPTAVSGLEAGAVSVSVGEDSGCALLRSGFVACWGSNGSGVLTPSGARGRSSIARTLFAP